MYIRSVWSGSINNNECSPATDIRGQWILCECFSISNPILRPNSRLLNKPCLSSCSPPQLKTYAETFAILKGLCLALYSDSVSLLFNPIAFRWLTKNQTLWAIPINMLRKDITSLFPRSIKLKCLKFFYSNHTLVKFEIWTYDIGFLLSNRMQPSIFIPQNLYTNTELSSLKFFYVQQHIDLKIEILNLWSMIKIIMFYLVESCKEW